MLACCALASVATLVPTPIGKGPRYLPSARHSGFPCRFGGLHAGPRVHLELFANRRVVIVPARLGVGERDCHGAAWTLDPTGVVRFRPGTSLGGVFAIWGRLLRPDRLLSFGGRVSLYVNGHRRGGDARRLVLRAEDEIVLEVRGYVPPHASYRFPP